ncbi:MAG TPA: PQQ-dependent sugar dehydrogenase [Candidatus Sumerlaeota bacterium]|nr:PQQ-dependent sugar dehydrogenase [Candidatus Sumerlaeota bacterium]
MTRSFFFAFCLGLSATAFAASDVQWTFGDDTMFNYILNSKSSDILYDGTLPANDPTLNLIIGKRYGVTIQNPVLHPFQVLAKGTTFNTDVVLLSMGGTTGSFESDSEVDWTDSGGTVEFTLTPALAAAMAPDANHTPGYRCGMPVDMMRGDFIIYGKGMESADPIPGPIPQGPFVIDLEDVVTGLISPLGVTEPDDGSGRLFVWDQNGTVHIIDNGTLLPTPFLDVSSRLVSLGLGGPGGYDERGLLGFAMHPNFAANPLVYTYTSEPASGSADFELDLPVGVNPNHDSVIAEWQVDAGNPNLIDLSSRRELLRIEEPQFNHNGGALHFDASGHLFISLGDGGAADDQGNGHGEGNAQNIETILGSILRIDPHGNNSANGQYGIPATNPFVGVPGVDEIYAYGLRNPYSFSIDRVTGDLYVGDAGQNDIEEVTVITAPGANLGWNRKEGSFFFDPNGSGPGFVTTEPAAPIPSGLLDPLVEYDHDEGVVVVGGFVYRSSEFPAFDGTYICGEFSKNDEGRLFYVDGDDTLREFLIEGGGGVGIFVKGFGQDQAGNVYVTGSNETGTGGTSGVVKKIVPVEVPVGLSSFIME